MGGLADTSRNLDLCREAFFYETFPKSNFPAGVLPAVYIRHGSMASGYKLLLLEDLSPAIQTGYFFGSGSPLNWGKDLSSILAGADGATAQDICVEAASLAGRIHGKYWMQTDLLSHRWLRGAGWWQGADQDKWTASQEHVRGMWLKTKTKIAAGDADSYKVNWNPAVVATIDASFSKISWDLFQSRVREQPWTLVHGDFHPANMLWRAQCAEGQSHLVLVDWEMVGIGCGPQELAQFMISHATPEFRREQEPIVQRRYYEELTRLVSPDQYSWADCQRDYAFGGAEKWIWLLAYLSQLCPDRMVQYFHDQVAAFLDDHGVNHENVGQPRS